MKLFVEVLVFPCTASFGWAVLIAHEMGGTSLDYNYNLGAAFFAFLSFFWFLSTLGDRIITELKKK